MENVIKRQETECNPEKIKQELQSVSSAAAAESYLDNLVKQRKSINKNAIICEKLKTGN